MDSATRGNFTMADIGLLEQVCAQVSGHTICAFGDAAAWPIQGLMRAFRPLVEGRAIDYQAVPLPVAAE